MKKNRKYIYGFNKSINQIKKEYPFDSLLADEKLILSSKYTVTYDIFLAYELRKKGYEVLVWGAIYRHRNVFVFNKKPIKTSCLPF